MRSEDQISGSEPVIEIAVYFNSQIKLVTGVVLEIWKESADSCSTLKYKRTVSQAFIEDDESFESFDDEGSAVLETIESTISIDCIGYCYLLI